MAPKKTIKKSEEPINEVNEIDNIKTETESKPKKTKPQLLTEDPQDRDL